MKSANVVVYAVGDGARRAIASVVFGSENAAMRVQHAASQEFARCEKSGVAPSRVVVVLEERTSNEAGQQTGERFTPLDSATLKPIGEARRELAPLFA